MTTMTIARGFLAPFGWMRHAPRTGGKPKRNIRREHLALRGLDDHLLRDLGLTRADVERETGRHFWL